MASNVIQFPARAANLASACPSDELGEARYQVAKVRQLLSEPIEDDEEGYRYRVREAMLVWWERELARLIRCWRGPASNNVIELRRA